jgi:hypothetical protein
MLQRNKELKKLLQGRILKNRCHETVDAAGKANPVLLTGCGQSPKIRSGAARNALRGFSV